MTKKTLTELEMVQIDLGNAEERERMLELAALRAKATELMLHAKVATLQAQLKEKELMLLEQSYARVRAEHKQFVKKLRESLGVKPDEVWGFDPETGKVHITPKGE